MKQNTCSRCWPRRLKSEAHLERLSAVSPCNPPPKVLSPAGGSGLSRRCSLLADNDTPSLSTAGIALGLVQRRLRVHFLAVFYLQTLTLPPYPPHLCNLELRAEDRDCNGCNSCNSWTSSGNTRTRWCNCDTFCNRCNGRTTSARSVPNRLLAPYKRKRCNTLYTSY